jgi:hypothetical protein
MRTRPRPDISRLSVVVAGLGLCLIGGCATRPRTDAPAAWNLIETEQEAKLAWGRPDSDEVGLMLTCAPHSGAVVLTAPVAPGAQSLVLSSDNRSAAFAGPVEIDPETDAPLLSARAPIAEPTLARFVRTGRLSAHGPNGALVMTASESDQARVHAFFSRCGG